MDKAICFVCKVKLIFNNTHGFYYCPDCGGEWWPGNPGHGLKTVWDDEQRYKKSISKPGGCSRNGKDRDKKQKIKLMTERYQLE
jgi:Zn-finger nucleic acid-binding protein